VHAIKRRGRFLRLQGPKLDPFTVPQLINLGRVVAAAGAVIVSEASRIRGPNDARIVVALAADIQGKFDETFCCAGSDDGALTVSTSLRHGVIDFRSATFPFFVR
jgi:hypothetical protein